MAGPFSVVPFNGEIIISPIGLVEKKSKDDYRLIFDLSYPRNKSVNDGIDHDLCTVQYTNFDKAIEMVHDLGQGSFLTKIDIQSAFRLLPIHPKDFRLLGMSHLDKYYVDKTLPFGCSISCAHFERFSTFLEFCIRNHTDSEFWIHYLDDFLAGNEQLDTAKCIKRKALDLFKYFGVPYAPEKNEGPTTKLTFLGIEIDTIAMVVRLPTDKVKNLLDTIESFITKYQQKVTLKQMQSLIGKLNFACRAIRPGRPFCRRFINTTIGLSNPNHHIRISSSVLHDLLVWKEFLTSHNGVSVMLPNSWEDNETLQFYTDSAGSLGWAIIFGKKWVAAPWPQHMSVCKRNNAFLELFPIVVAMMIWGHKLTNSKVIFNCDNMAVVNMISQQTSRDPDCMTLIRKMVLICLRHNILFKSKHVSGSKNLLADSLSRLQIQKFKTLCPDAEESMTAIPLAAWSLLVKK